MSTLPAAPVVSPPSTSTATPPTTTGAGPAAATPTKAAASKYLPTRPFEEIQQEFAGEIQKFSRTYLPKMVFDANGFVIPFGRTLQYLEFGAGLDTEAERQWGASGFLSSQMSFEVALLSRDPELFELIDKHGVPATHRRQVWSLLAKVTKKRESATPTYWQQLSQKTVRQVTTPHQIEIDLSRTFSNHPLFSSTLLPGGSSSTSGTALLRHVLVAYSERNANVGYCQSMNYLAGFLLIALRGDVETSFWILCSIVEELLFDYYTHRMQGISVDQAAFSDILPRLFPELHRHWQEIGLQWAEMQHSTTFRWFLTMYSSGCEIFPSHVLMYIWDQFFLHGAIVLFEVGLTLFKLCEKELLESTAYLDLPSILRNQANGMFDRDHFATALQQTRKALVQANINLTEVRQKVIFRACTARSLKVSYQSFPLKVATNGVPPNLLRDVSRKYASADMGSLSLEPNSLLHILVCLQQANTMVPGEVLEEASIPAESIRMLFSYIDVDSDGKVSFEELAVGLLLRVFYSGTLEDHLRFAYHLLSPIDARAFITLIKILYCVAFQNAFYLTEESSAGFVSPVPLSFEVFSSKLRMHPRLMLALHGEHNASEQERQEQWRKESARLFK